MQKVKNDTPMFHPPQQPERRSGGSMMWAILLIGVGVVWLLVQIGLLTGANLAVLARIWPLILIAAGVNLLVARDNPGISRIIAIATLVIVLALMVVGPAIGLAPNVARHTAEYTTEIDGAESARISIDGGFGPLTVTALTDSTALFTADTAYVGELDYNVSGESTRSISLGFRSENVFNFNFLGVTIPNDNLYTNVALSPEVPFDIHVTGGFGDTTLDLTGLQLSSLTLDGGFGGHEIILPASDTRYSVDISGGFGDARVTALDGAAFTLTLNGGFGQLTLDVPNDAPAHVSVDGGFGDNNIPSDWNRRGDDYYSPTYNEASADDRIDVQISGGFGSVNVR